MPYEIGLTEHIDLALILLYLFWLFFFGLVIYLNREGMREGFPGVNEFSGKPVTGDWLPSPKAFKLDDGQTIMAPHPEEYGEPANARAVAPFAGAPLEPQGDPMLSEFGAGAYANRMDIALKTLHGGLKITPLRNLPEFDYAKEDPSLVGCPVIAADGVKAGEIIDVWVDVEEQLIRYVEVAVEGGPKVLCPMTLVRLGSKPVGRGKKAREARVESLMSFQFANVPTTKSPDEVTLLEEDKIVAYYGAGKLYAAPSRRNPLV